MRRLKFRSVIPELRVADVAATLTFYHDVLGFSIEGRHEDESGSVVFGSVLCGGANIYFSRHDAPVPVSRCWIFVDDVDVLRQVFASRGARVTEEVENKPWGYRQFTVEDLNGHQLTFFEFGGGVE